MHSQFPGRQSAGEQVLRWLGDKQLASGVFTYQLRIGEHVVSGNVVRLP